MDLNQLVDKLMYFGLTRQEATVYLCLIQNGNMTGYEAAKLTGVSRSNAYNALAGLVDKGAAYTTEGNAVKYHSVEAEEFCLNKIRCLEQMKEQIQENLPKTKPGEEGYLTISGDLHIQDKVKNMLLQAEKRIYLTMDAKYIELFQKEIAHAVSKDIKVVILTDHSLNLKNVVLYLTEAKKNQIGVIADSSNVLTGELGKGDDSTCLYSGQSNFVKVFKDSLSNEIKLIQLLKGDS